MTLCAAICEFQQDGQNEDAMAVYFFFRAAQQATVAFHTALYL